MQVHQLVLQNVCWVLLLRSCQLSKMHLGVENKRSTRCSKQSNISFSQKLVTSPAPEGDISYVALDVSQIVWLFSYNHRQEKNGERSQLRWSGGWNAQVALACMPTTAPNQPREKPSARAALLNFNDSLCCGGASLCPFIRRARKELIGQ